MARNATTRTATTLAAPQSGDDDMFAPPVNVPCLDRTRVPTLGRLEKGCFSFIFQNPSSDLSSPSPKQLTLILTTLPVDCIINRNLTAHNKIPAHH
jgi:hypothetical protein